MTKQRCGAKPPDNIRAECSLDPGHAGSHYTEVDGVFVRWLPGTGAREPRKPYEAPAIEQSASFGGAELAALDGGCPADCSCDLFGRECRAPVSSSVRRGSVRYPLSRTVRLSHNELAAYLAAAERAGLELHDWMRRALAQAAATEAGEGSEGSSGAALRTAPRRPAARAVRRKRSSPRTW